MIRTPLLRGVCKDVVKEGVSREEAVLSMSLKKQSALPFTQPDPYHAMGRCGKR